MAILLLCTYLWLNKIINVLKVFLSVLEMRCEAMSFELYIKKNLIKLPRIITHFTTKGYIHYLPDMKENDVSQNNTDLGLLHLC